MVMPSQGDCVYDTVRQRQDDSKLLDILTSVVFSEAPILFPIPLHTAYFGLDL